MSSALTPMETEVYSYEQGFNDVNACKLNFKKEAGYALQLLKSNEFLRTVAQKNPDSLKSAITNIAAIGLSLIPSSKEVYLIPRAGSIYADVSYIGLANLATKGGHLLWVQAEIVKKNDEFIFQGLGKAPTHTFNHFAERGEIVGVYCMAKTSTGEVLSTIMTKLECDQIRDKCSKGSTSWKDFYEEMLKKTVIKRASKLWPKSERLEKAIEVINQHEGIDFNKSSTPFMPEGIEQPNDKAFDNIRALLKAKGKTEEGLLDYLSKQSGEIIASINDMNSAQIEASYRILGGAK